MDRQESYGGVSAPLRQVSGSYVDIPAVLGGAIVATALGGLFTTFGAGLGLSTLSAEPGEGSINMWLFVTALWMVITIVVSFMAGGYIAGRMRRRVDEASSDEVSARDGINGLIVWGLGLILTGWMAASVVSGAASVAGSAVSATGSAVGGVAQGVGAAAGGALGAAGAAVAEGDDQGQMSYITDSLLRPALSGAQQSTGFTTPGTPSANDADLARQTGVVLGNVLRTGEISDEDRQFLVAATAQRTGMSQADVEARVETAVTRVQETRAQAEQLVEDAKQAAIDAAETARISTILSVFLMTAAALVAAAAATIGAVRGGSHRDEGRIYGGFSHRR